MQVSATRDPSKEKIIKGGIELIFTKLASVGEKRGLLLTFEFKLNAIFTFSFYIKLLI